MMNPSGTGSPIVVISASPAPLPPSRARISFDPWEKSYTYPATRAECMSLAREGPIACAACPRGAVRWADAAAERHLRVRPARLPRIARRPPGRGAAPARGGRAPDRARARQRQPGRRWSSPARRRTGRCATSTPSTRRRWSRSPPATRRRGPIDARRGAGARRACWSPCVAALSRDLPRAGGDAARRAARTARSGGRSRTSRAGSRRCRARVGRRLAIVNRYVPWTFSGWQDVSTYLRGGHLPLISWSAAPHATAADDRERQPGRADPGGRGGAQARRRQGLPAPVLRVRPAAGPPALHRHAARRSSPPGGIWPDIFRAAGATNVRLVWCPMAFDFHGGIARVVLAGQPVRELGRRRRLQLPRQARGTRSATSSRTPTTSPTSTASA